MATGTLTSTTIAARYLSLLKLTGTGNDVLAADASAKYIEDGDGNDSVLSLSTTRVGIGNNAPTALLTAGAITTLLTDGTTAVTPEGVNVHITEASKYAMGIKNADASGDGLIIQAGDAADDFALRVEDYDSANDLLVVLGDGNVGIGTATPAEIFSIKGDAGRIIMEDGSGNAAIYMGDDAGGFLNLYNAAGDTILIHLDADDDSHVTNQFGIGTTSPDYLLDVESAGDSIKGRFWNGTQGVLVYVYAAYSGIGTATSQRLDLLIGGNPKLSIASGGDVGIGTISPDGKLEISKDSADTTLIISSYDDSEPTAPKIILRKAEGTEASHASAIDDNAVQGIISFQGYDGDEFLEGARIEALTNTDSSDGDMGTNLNFYTNNSSNSTTLVGMFHTGGDFYTNDSTVSDLSSDMRVKKDIETFPFGLDEVNKLLPKYFKFNGKSICAPDNNSQKVGFIADDILDNNSQEFKDWFVEYRTEKIDGVEVDDYKNLKGTSIIYAMVNAIQELSAKVIALENA